MKHLFAAGATLTVAAVVVTAVLVGGGAAPSSARAASPTDGLSAYVTPTNRGPLPPCPPSGCTGANLVQEFIHVINSNQLTNEAFLGNRTAVTNAFVVSSVDETILVNGAVFSQGTLTPPPNLTDRFGSAGRWPATVTCGQPPTVPCNVVLNPAILPGENTVIFFERWFHASDEPNGTYVFRFTVHGTLNGTPVDLPASSPSIRMTA
jgi:hypothetical protein